eukprot:TRINITY_DN37394_c0_g1_i1.p1 TRINITY_DN37394_c0_g1~~TRINITY_DN37394_c0_g1_i1.p1  ORF type:complete len:377 (+),score=86.78 TRINITY_DN37394_c0_g1_i1:135-1265(+)
MAFAGAFSPTLLPATPPLRAVSSPASSMSLGASASPSHMHAASPRLGPSFPSPLGPSPRPSPPRSRAASPGSTTGGLEDALMLPPLAVKMRLSLDGDEDFGRSTSDEDDAGGEMSPTKKSAQFAPMLQLRRRQVLEEEAVAAAQPGGAGGPGLPDAEGSTEEERVQDALGALDALRDAELSAGHVARFLGLAAGLSIDAAIPVDELGGLDSKVTPSLRAVVVQKDAQPSWASVALALGGALLAAPLAGSAGPGGCGVASPAPCVEGLLCVDMDSDLASDLCEVLRRVLLQLCEPLAAVESVVLTPVGDASEGRFAYRVAVADTNDVEPLRETLLLEAESGGARSFLPLLLEELCNAEDGAAMPRHLKVRLEVRGST